MKESSTKKCIKKSSRHTNELKDCDMFERDLNKFLNAEAEASATINLAMKEKRKSGKKIFSNQVDIAHVDFENLKKKWGKWYTFGKNEDGQYTAMCRACSSWYVGINKKELADGTPMRGYEYTKPHPITHGKQKLGWDGHLKDQERKHYSKRAHWRAVRGLETQHTLVHDPSNNQAKNHSS